MFISEPESLPPPLQHTDIVLCDDSWQGSEPEQALVFNEQDLDDLNDSGMEEEASYGARKFANENTQSGLKPVPLYAVVKKSSGDRSNAKVTTEGQATEPFYHILEEPGNDSEASEENWDERIKTASFYQSLMQCKQDIPEGKHWTSNQENVHGFTEGYVMSRNSIYQSLSPLKHDDVSNEKLDLTEDESNRVKNVQKESTGFYQPLLNRSEGRSRLHAHSDRPRSVSGVYQPLRSDSDNIEPLVRNFSAPAQENPGNVHPMRPRSGNEECSSEPIYHTVDDDDDSDRCLLNLDDPGSSFPSSGRRTSQGSLTSQQRTIQEPLYIAVKVTPTRSRRTFNAKQEPRYSPSPVRKNTATLKPTSRGHRRNFSDFGRAFPVMVGSVGADSRSPPAVHERCPTSPLPLRLGHRRNRSDAGLCPVDLSQKNAPERPTSSESSLSATKIPRESGDTSSSVGRRSVSPLPRHLGHRRIRSDAGFCPVNYSQGNVSHRGETSANETKGTGVITNPRTEGTSPPVKRPRESQLIRHIGQHRNRSDIGIGTVEPGEGNASRRMTSISDSGLPQTPSLGSPETGEFSRSATDATHCRVYIGP